MLIFSYFSAFFLVVRTGVTTSKMFTYWAGNQKSYTNDLHIPFQPLRAILSPLHRGGSGEFMQTSDRQDACLVYAKPGFEHRSA